MKSSSKSKNLRLLATTEQLQVPFPSGTGTGTAYFFLTRLMLLVPVPLVIEKRKTFLPSVHVDPGSEGLLNLGKGNTENSWNNMAHKPQGGRGGGGLTIVVTRFLLP